MAKLGSRKVLKSEFCCDIDMMQKDLEAIAREGSKVLNYKDAHKSIKEIVVLIEESYRVIEEYKKDCEKEEEIIKNIPF